MKKISDISTYSIVRISMISTVHEGSRLIVIRGFKINLDLRTYGNSTQLLQAKLKLLQVYKIIL